MTLENNSHLDHAQKAQSWRAMGAVAHFKFVDPASAERLCYNQVECFVRALEIAPTLARAWRNLSLELDRRVNIRVSVAGNEHTALTAII